jgi:type VI secretion system secreted protein Hcp
VAFLASAAITGGHAAHTPAVHPTLTLADSNCWRRLRPTRVNARQTDANRESHPMPTISSASSAASSAAAGRAGAGADMFLHVQTKRGGKIKGEATIAGHEDDILLTGWQWGLEARMAPTINGIVRAGRAYTALRVNKVIDRASTGLMSALATNDEVKEAVLSMRRAAGAQDDYFSIKLKKARIASVRHEGQADGSTQEQVTLTFTEVEVEYHPQQSTGLKAGSTTFNDEIHPEDSE